MEAHAQRIEEIFADQDSNSFERQQSCKHSCHALQQWPRFIFSPGVPTASRCKYKRTVESFPSYREGFGNQLLEAVALGKGVVVCHAYPVMEADILPLPAPDGIISLGNNSDYVLDATGFVHLKEDVLQAAVEREIHFLLHPDAEQHAAQKTRRGLALAFDASVVGNQMAELLLKFS